LIDDAKRGLADIAAGRTFEADAALAQLQQQRKTAIKFPAKQRG
jgi:predicted transcriptional regulator